MKAYRHGEMILIPVPKNLQDQWQNLFKQAGRKMDNPRVIAEGEVTGHKHEFSGGQVDAVALGNNAAATGTATSGYVTRRSFLSSLGIGAIAGPVILLKVAKASTLKHGSLRHCAFTLREIFRPPLISTFCYGAT